MPWNSVVVVLLHVCTCSMVYRIGIGSGRSHGIETVEDTETTRSTEPMQDREKCRVKLKYCFHCARKVSRHCVVAMCITS